MAAPSRPPTNKAYGCDGRCLACGAKVPATSSAWFRGFPKPQGVFCDGICYGVLSSREREAA